MYQGSEKQRLATRLASRRYRAAHPDRRRFIHTKHTFGVTKEMYDKRMEEQKSRCAICFEEFVKTPHVDHDHETGEFRGLLCRACNWLLGNARDEVKLLQRAIDYLKKYGEHNGSQETPVLPHPH